MEKDEIIKRQMAGDARIFDKIQQAKKTDKSFTERGLFGITPKYNQSEVREIWFSAMTLGMQEGLYMASLPGQRMDLYHNCKNENQKEFLDKFYKLAEEYNCAIIYHPLEGMCIVDLNR